MYVFFCLHVGGPITGGGAYKRQFTVLLLIAMRDFAALNFDPYIIDTTASRN